MDPIVSAACELLSQGQAFVLATIVCRQGSTPRTAGTRMLITPRRQIVGTIGGGLLEAETMQAASRMSAKAPARFLAFDLSNQDAANMEMICGGRTKVLLEYIRPDDNNRLIFDCWYESLSQGRRAMFVSTVTGNEEHIAHIEHAVLKNDGCAVGPLALDSDMGEKLGGLLTTATHIQVLEKQETLVVADPGRIAPALYIFGGGHVARPTAHLAAMVGFDVTVLDDRAEFSSAARFPDARQTRTLKGFDTAFEDLQVNADSYVIIVTRGHLHDRTVLAQALKTPAAYIGMIGSRRKRDTIYERLLQDGYKNEDIARVHCPIGLNIGADTPEEIAVSIAGELVAVRAGVERK